MIQRLNEILETEIIRTLKDSLPVGGYITPMDIVTTNEKIQATFFLDSLDGRMWVHIRLNEFMKYKVRRVVELATKSGLFNGFTITEEWVGPVEINKRRQKRKLRAWVKRVKEEEDERNSEGGEKK
jgi:hypothetical protein